MARRSANEDFARHGAKAKPRKVSVGGADVITHGMPRGYLQDAYHLAMTLSWPAFGALCACAFLALNAFFGLLYMAEPGSIANQFPEGFLGSFFFSVETLATVGYGDMHPSTLYAHVVSTCEIFIGMALVALATGAIFARFSLPHARILFADHPVACVMDGSPP